MRDYLVAVQVQRLFSFFASRIRLLIKHRSTVDIFASALIRMGAGFLFWIVATQTHSASDVGIATAVISAASLVVAISTFGFEYGLLRFFDQFKNIPRRLIESTVSFVLVSTFVFSFVFVIGMPLWAKGLQSSFYSPVMGLVFIILALVTSLHLLFHRIYIAVSRTEFTLLQSTIAGSVRFIPLFLIPVAFHGSLTLSWIIGIGTSVFIGLVFIIPRFMGNRFIRFRIEKDVIGTIGAFSFKSGVGSFLNSATALIVPLLVVNILGTEQNAYFYMSWALANILVNIPVSSAWTVLAEGSRQVAIKQGVFRRELKLSILILVPLIIIVFLWGDKILSIFGSEYSFYGYDVLKLLAISSLPMTFNYLYLSTLAIDMKMKEVITFNAVITSISLVGSYALLPLIGLNGVGLSWLTAHCLVLIYILIRKYSRQISTS
ncbi:oligosaccharide repeat unit transporter [Dehalogenimonas sp. WBC-2]|nr:oligosaccharide repeat unit transporter [Dehalogenimonas sp. WBC-2]